MTVTQNLLEHIAQRRSERQKQRDDRLDELDLPRTMTQRQVNEYKAETMRLGQRLVYFDRVVAEYNACISADADADVRWKDHQRAWRKQLCDKRMTIKSPIRDRDLQAEANSLEFSIKLIDLGFGINRLVGPIVDLSSLPLGELMAAAGYAVNGPDLYGPNGWRGSLPEVETRIANLAKRRAAAEAALDEVLLSHDERAAREAEADELRAAGNSLRLKGNAEGTGVIARDADGNELPVSAMTPLQRKAFERANAAYAPPTA